MVFRMKLTTKIIPTFLVLFAFLFQSLPADGDGGFIPVGDFNVYEPGQNALICWNGDIERLYLSVNIRSDEDTEGVHIVPFPSTPRITLGNITVFENLTNAFQGKLMPGYGSGEGGYNDGLGGNASFEIEMQEMIGEHNVTVIRVTDPENFKDQVNDLLTSIGLSIEKWPDTIDDVIYEYTLRDFKYFSIDRFPIKKEERSIDPLIYEFKTNELVFPLEISSILKGHSSVTLGVLVPEDLPIDPSPGMDSVYYIGEAYFTREEVLEIDMGLQDMFDGGCVGIYFKRYVDLETLSEDFIIGTYSDTIWMRSSEECERYIVNGIHGPRLLLYSSHPGDHADTLTYMDEQNGNIFWKTRIEFDEEEELESRKVILDDMDGDGKEDILVVDCFEDMQYITRLDPYDGSEFWQTQLSYSPKTWDWKLNPGTYNTLEDADSAIHILIPAMTWDRFLILKLEDGSFRYRKPFMNDLYIGWVNIVVSPEGDRVLFWSDERIYLWDPWPDDNGQVVWNQPCTADGYHYIPSSIDGDDANLIIPAAEGVYHVLDALTGAKISEWRHDGHLSIISGHIGHEDAIEGLFYTSYYGSESNTYVFHKVDLISGEELWNVRMNTKRYPEDIRIFDLDGDGTDEIIIRWHTDYQWIGGTFDWLSLTTIHDRMTGEIIWEGDYLFLDAGMDCDNDGILEILLESRNSLIDIELIDGSEVFRLNKSVPEDITYYNSNCLEWGDFNGDGFDDILVTSFHYRMGIWEFEGISDLSLFDGYEMRFDEIVNFPGPIRKAYTSPENNPMNYVIVQSGTRIYSLPLRSTITLESDRQIVSKGGQAAIVANVRGNDGPVTDAEIVWESSVDGDDFSETEEILPGTYVVRWTAPRDFIGKVVITARVRASNWSLGMASTELVVVEGAEIRPDTATNVSARFVPGIVELDQNAAIYVSLSGYYDPYDVLINVVDINSRGEIIPFQKISDSLWISSYIPRGSTGTIYLYMKVVSSNVLIWDGILELFVLEPDDTGPEVVEEPSISLFILPDTAYQGSNVTLLVSCDNPIDLLSVEFAASDNMSGGSFSEFKTISDCILYCIYSVPFREEPITILVEARKDDVVIARSSSILNVIKEGEQPIEPDGTSNYFEVTYYQTPGDPKPGEDRHLFIFSQRNGYLLSDISFSVVHIPEGWNYSSDDDQERDVIHIILKNDKGESGPFIIRLQDDSGNARYISIYLEGQSGDEVDEEEMDADDDDEKDSGDHNIGLFLVIFTVILLSAAIVFFTIYVWRKDLKNRDRNTDTPYAATLDNHRGKRW